ncbi:MAG: N-acetylmuramoyl-L-alanine amidase [Zoogloea sp.]|nr:N-acetylmuramoyl-L-alanine amidase [Zoogloea sp.]
MAIVVVDPGHGGSAAVGGSSPNNATGPAGTLEKTLTLQIGRRLAVHLSAAGHTAVLTRDADVNLGLTARAEIARARQAALFLSIHLNGDANPAIQGSETWLHSMHSAASADFAAAIQRRLVVASGLRNRGVKSKELGVLNSAHHWPGTACCLVEVSFLTDPHEEARLDRADYQDEIAKALAQAMADALAKRMRAVPTFAPADIAIATRRRTVEAIAEGVADEDEWVAGEDAALPCVAVTDSGREAELWAAHEPIATAALRFWNRFLGLRMGAGTGQPLDHAALNRLQQIVRAVSWVESKHGTAGANHPAEDPLQCGNPKDVWWRELTGQADSQDRFVRGPGLSNLWASELPAAAHADPEFAAGARLEALTAKKKGHADPGFSPSHSYWWGVPYLVHRMNTEAGDKTYQCGSLSRRRLLDGAAAYNGGGDPAYPRKLEEALALIGDIPALPTHDQAIAMLSLDAALAGAPRLAPTAISAVAAITAAVAPDCSSRLLVDALAGAREEILVYVYNLSARHLVGVLLDALERRVTVTLMYDTTDARGEEAEVIRTLSAAGARVRPAPSSGGRRVFTVCHQKYAVIDARTLVLGSANWASTAFPLAAPGEFRKGNREWVVRVDERRVAEFFIELFWADWNLPESAADATIAVMEETGARGILVPARLSLPDNHRIFEPLAIADDDADVLPLLSPDNYYHETLRLVGTAKRSIGIEQQYILGTSSHVADLLQAVKARADDGVDVRIIASPAFRRAGIDNWERTVASLKAVGLDDRLRALNLEVFTHCHNKGVVIDCEAVIVSSTNWSGNSLDAAREAGLLIRSPRIAGYFADALDNDFETGWATADVADALATLASAALFDEEGYLPLPAADVAV